MTELKNENAELKKEMDIEHTRYVEEGVKRANTMFAVAEVIDDEYDYRGGEDELIDMSKTLRMENEWGKTATLKWNQEKWRNEKLEKDNEALKSKDKLASGIIGALNDRERQLEKEKNHIWDRNTQLKFDMDKLEKKVKRQQETITEQRKDILILRAKE